MADFNWNQLLDSLIAGGAAIGTSMINGNNYKGPGSTYVPPTAGQDKDLLPDILKKLLKEAGGDLGKGAGEGAGESFFTSTTGYLVMGIGALMLVMIVKK
jgi:hypothetical protein